MPQAENNTPLPNREAVSAKEALDKMQQLIAEAPDKKKLVEALTGVQERRPPSARAMSRYSYYKERFALEFKAVLDEMIQEHSQGIIEDRMYNYEDFKDTLNPNSLYLKITQARMYLLDKMDPDKKYAAFCEMLAIERERGIGIRLFYQRDVIKGSSFKPSKVVPRETSHKWKDDVDDFLENGVVGEELELIKLALSEEDKRTLEESLLPLDNIVAKITRTSIKLAKI